MKKPLCLIIEDHLSSAQLYTRLLEVVNYESQICTSYAEALACLDELTPDLIILDLRLAQRQRGRAILDRIKGDARLAETRIIVVTAYATRAKDLEDEVDLAILKPINARELINTFETLG